MRKVTEDDWKEYNFPTATNSILASVMDGQPCAYHLYWISMLYKRYRLGDWNGAVPSEVEISDKEILVGYNDEYCLFHKQHPKFGPAILEGLSPYNPREFTFFDYTSLSVAFAALDEDEQLPYIPTYYAHPHDRHDYITGAHMW